MTKWQAFVLIAVVVVQACCAIFFVSDILLSYFDVPAAPVRWQAREYLEIAASLGLLIGVVMGWIVLRRTIGYARRARWRNEKVETQLRAASGAFLDVMQDQFSSWGLTPAERDVALFLVKGLPTVDIAAMRSTSEGTIKAQTNAIYRKAGVSGRPQLLSLFIEDLMVDALPGLAPMPAALA